MINYDNCAEVYRELHRKLCKGHHELMNWEQEFETDKEMQEAWSAKKERIRWRTTLKVQGLMMYFLKLRLRAEERTKLAAAVVNAVDQEGVAGAYDELVNHNADNVHAIADEVALFLNSDFTGRTLQS